MTAALAGAFQSLVEDAGLKLHVDCAPLPAPVYVDRGRWEKLFSNLISNAFKFTFEGEITVRLSWRGDHVELEIQDTGTGIPEHELPRLFERFHRVAGAEGRSFEGSGIGLARVREIAELCSDPSARRDPAHRLPARGRARRGRSGDPSRPTRFGPRTTARSRSR